MQPAILYKPPNDTNNAVGAGCMGGNCDQQCTCYDREDCAKRNGRCPYGRCALGWRGFPDCSHRDCSVRNGGCRQKCVSGRVSNWCACWEGYVLQDDGVSCVENDSLCLRDRKGSEYRGTMAVTRGGMTCRSYAEVGYTQYNHNYCRNTPGAPDPVPWCMVAPYTLHVPCNIPLCSAVDPCHPSNHECPLQCVRIQANMYSCRCYPGYSGNGRVCNDTDECSGDSHGCSFREQCVNTAGGYYCECAAGYHLDTETYQCTDIDECNNREETGVPASCHICDNLPGSYQCRCDIGYEPSDDSKSCVACSRGFYGLNCTLSCHCHDGAACLAQDGRCPHGRCSPGWRGFPYCNYRDCALNNGGCQQRCVSGKERDCCSCWEGYTLLDDGTTCAADDSICLRDANGLQYNGTLSMSSTGETCQPWDSAVYPEYRHNFCRNQAASAPNQPWCFSALGYPVTCSIPICSELDQCADDNGGCQQECSSSAQQPHHCNRFPGYQGVDALIRNCTDIDECSEGSHSCMDGECCVNTDGGYYCECAAGYYLDMDTSQCTASAADSSLGACGHQYEISPLLPAGSPPEIPSHGAAIGGGIGGLACLVLLAVVLIMVYHKCCSQSTQSGTEGEQVVDYMNVVNDQATDGKCECPMLHDEMEDGVYDEIAELEPTRRTVLGTEPREGMYTEPPISASPPAPSCYDALLHAQIADAQPVQTSAV